MRKITTPVRSAGPTGQAGICLIFRGFIRHRILANKSFEHNAEIGPRLNIKYGFNPDGIKRKTNSIGQAGQAKRPFMDGH